MHQDRSGTSWRVHGEFLARSRLCPPGHSRIPRPRSMSCLPSCQFLTGALGNAALMPRKFLCGRKAGTGRAQPSGDGDGEQENAARTRHRGLGAVPALPHPLESIREQFGLEIAARGRSRDGQTSNNAERPEAWLGQSSARTGHLRGLRVFPRSFSKDWE